ncbi:MAG TPA: YqiA/YcfP family alpha/beta fold hydrolase [Burkholderiales bacterium]|nr:YqiA/YcfP family alpha/beta fold hydrolase [Burkholderiales bacterium]
MLIYLHGFNSDPASHKAQLMREAMVERGLGHLYRCPKLPYVPNDAIIVVEEEIKTAKAGKTEETDITLVGSSLGGFYSTYLAQKHGLKAVLINPAVHPQQRLERYLGPQKNMFTGEAYELKHEHIEQWRALDVRVTEPQRFLLIVETGDEVLDYRLAVSKYAGAEQIVVSGGDHSLQSFPAHIPRILQFAGLRGTL